jgi:ATP-dependent DNA helicase RecG
MDIYSEIKNLKGVGPKLEEKLNKCGVFTLLDLLLYFPRDYEFVDGNPDISDISEELKQIISCKVVSFDRDIRTKNGKKLTSINFKYSDTKVMAKWFNQPYIKNNFKIGESYNLMGKYKKVGSHLEVINPTVVFRDASDNEILPVYPLKGDITSSVISKLVNSILCSIVVGENLPEYLLEKYSLISLDEAIRNIHFPSTKEKLKAAITRLKFQELFTYSVKLMMLKNHLKKGNCGIKFSMSTELGDLKKALPYELTSAQSRVVREILLDQKSSVPMNRLVQGDVGSGKTVVAFISIFNVYKNGYQTAMMAPTEILASQHYVEAKKLLEGFDVDIELLTGSTPNKEKMRIKEKISSGVPIVVIGTHAIIQEDVNFTNLGLVVTDEQHRFGVEQRSKLINKGKEPDVLVMTATPIPRTLALYLYSDLDVSIIDELPPGRKKIETLFFQEDSRQQVYNLALDEIEKGRQVYIVCPLIEEDEDGKLNSVDKIYNELAEGTFKNYNIEKLHGKMAPKDKEYIINRFKEGHLKAIISTTVIEVGVNVPNASVMIIENCERFGLSQLHQLRGRVGRGQYQSYCLLVGNAKNNVTKKRMMIMTESNDGFYIAEQDLKLRGSGEMFGLRQSGDSGLILSDIIEDINILKCASEEAKRILNSTDTNNIKLISEISKNLSRSSKYICFN